MSDYNPSIYVACLASYNKGILHGHWLSALDDESDIEQAIQVMLDNSPTQNAEEWAIHDYDDFGPFYDGMGEYENLTSICQKAQFLLEHGELGATLMAESYYQNFDETAEALQDDYHGEWDSERDFAEHIFTEVHAHDVPKPIIFYIDYELFKRDIFINDYFSVHLNGETHIFSYH